MTSTPAPASIGGSGNALKIVDARIISNTFMDTPIGDIGIVVAGAYAKRNYRSEIFNTVGYTTMGIASRGSLSCNLPY